MFDFTVFAKEYRTLPQPIKYKNWFAAYLSMITHTQGRVKKLLETKRPGEPDDVMTYRTGIMRAITKGSMNKGLDNLSFIFKNTSWSFVGSATLGDYLLQEKYDDGLAFKDYCECHVMKVGIDDANAVLVWLPEFDETLQMIAVKPHIYNSRKIRWISKDAYLIADLDVVQAASELDNDNFNVSYRYNENAERYLLVTTSGYYYITPPKGSTDSVIVEVIWEHDFADVPIVILGGNRTSLGYYESFFDAFSEFGDEALTCFSDHQAVNVQFSYPVREEKGMKCDYRTKKVFCNKGYLSNDPETKCPMCKGSGLRSIRSPWGAYITTDNGLTDDKSAAVPAVQFHSPDTGILDYSSGEWDKMLDKAERAIHLVYIDEAQSGEAKKQDQKGLIALLKKIGANYYGNIIFNSLWIIEQTINANPVRPVVHMPVQYAIYEEVDPVDKINKLIAGGSPKYLVAVAIEEFLQHQYDDGNPIHKITATLIQYDNWFSYTQLEKERMLALGTIDKNEFRKAALSYPILRKIAAQKGNEFLSLTIDQLVVMLEKEIAPLLIPDATPQYDANGNLIP